MTRSPQHHIRPPKRTLSAREKQVFVMLAMGNSQTDVADSLHLSHKTVSAHLSRITEKTGMRAREVWLYGILAELATVPDCVQRAIEAGKLQEASA